MKKRGKTYFVTAITATLMLLGVMAGSLEIKQQEAEAAVQQRETVDIRIIGTTDIHGQLNSKDYEQGVDYNIGGLARLFNLIQDTRGELPKENTITLDAGDTLFDYTTEYIFSENQNAIQPIYKAMAKVGYDAITLGNHDFDYGYEYILKQLNASGLRDITVVSNVRDSKTGEYPFLENMLITRTVQTKSGKKVEVKVGIIGQTIPTLTSKTHSYAGILKTEDMVLNAKTQAKKLKEMGADIIVALSHTGMGPVSPELNFKNVAYALTKIPEIDVVVGGHEHNFFPTKDMTSPYYKLPGVDNKTYLINGKNVIMAGDRGKAIGVVDLQLELYGDTLSVVKRTSEIRMVKSDSASEDKTIAAFYGEWEDKLLEYSTDIIGELEKGMVIQNFTGLLGDNTAIQILNDSKINYALKYVNTTGKAYKSYPIIAASTYANYGLESVDNFTNIKDSITESELSAIQPYNTYLYIYTITGKQLKEWLEWTASAYETSSNVSQAWMSGTMADLMKENNLKSLIREEWLDDWSNFYVFDGINYTIDPSKEPRYDFSGNRINSTRRIQSVKYNGREVKDDLVLLIATDKITKPTDANKGIEKQVALAGFNRGQAILGKYLELLSKGNILPQIDNNWKVNFTHDYKFLVKAPYYAHDYIEGTKWFTSYLTEKNQYRYYIASYPKEDKDTTSPHIVVTPIITNATASPYSVAVHVSDESAIKHVNYLLGEYDINHPVWPVANKIVNQAFTVRENGVYTIYAEDIHGNKSVRNIVINNFSDNLLGRPTFVNYTNRKTKISGTAEPGATIIFEAYTGTYESKVSTSGNYSYSLPAQPSGTEVNVYIVDGARGLESERIVIPVKRTGPNQPSVNPINNNAGYIAGNTNDSDATVIAIIDDTVYVSAKGGKELYEKNTEIYNESLEIVETAIEISSGGYFTILLSPQEAGKSVKVYNIDHLSRNSRVFTTNVNELAPNAPIVYEVSNIEKSLRGYVPSTSKKIYDISLTIRDKTYYTQTDLNGAFTFLFEDQLYANQILKVTATDTKNGATRTSYPVGVKVNDIEKYIRNSSTNLLFDQATNKSYMISGTHQDIGTIYLAIAYGEGENFQNTLFSVIVDDDFSFMYLLDDMLEGGAKIYGMTRFTDGKILMSNKMVVLAGPVTPSLLKEVTNTDKLVQVIASKDCEIKLMIGSKAYRSSTYEFDELSGQYIYSIVIDRDISGTVITASATNATGTSDIFTSNLVKAAPELPLVNNVKAGDKVVKGKIELLNYSDPLLDGIVEGKTPARFKNAPANVAMTQTRIFAKIGTKTYEGTIDNKGNFQITIPKQSAGTAIQVWGTNKAGRGPLIKVVVVK